MFDYLGFRQDSILSLRIDKINKTLKQKITDYNQIDL
jgi:hypothetical protein